MNFRIYVELNNICTYIKRKIKQKLKDPVSRHLRKTVVLKCMNTDEDVSRFKFI